MLRYITALMVVFNAWGLTAHATTWSVSRTRDAVTRTEDVSVVASGHHGGGFLVRCHERELGFFLRVPPGLASASPTYRFRIDRSRLYRPSLRLRPDRHVVGHDRARYVDASFSTMNTLQVGPSVAQLIERLRAGHELVYQIPAKTGFVHEVSLSGSAQHLLPVVQACRRQRAGARRKPTQKRP